MSRALSISLGERARPKKRMLMMIIQDVLIRFRKSLFPDKTAALKATHMKRAHAT